VGAARGGRGGRSLAAARAVEGLIEDLLRARRRLALAERRPAAFRPPSPPASRRSCATSRAAPRVGLAALEVVVRELRRLADEI
jgi:hypothetical protein